MNVWRTLKIKKIIPVSILAIFFLSVVSGITNQMNFQIDMQYENSDENAEDESEELDLTDETTNQTTPNFVNTNTDPLLAETQIAESEAWQLGQTIKIEQDFTPVVITETDFRKTLGESGSMIANYNGENWESDDLTLYESFDDYSGYFLYEDYENNNFADHTTMFDHSFFASYPFGSAYESLDTESEYVEVALIFSIPSKQTSLNIEFHSYCAIKEAGLGRYWNLPAETVYDPYDYYGDDLETNAQTDSTMFFRGDITIRLRMRIVFNNDYAGGGEDGLKMTGYVDYFDYSTASFTNIDSEDTAVHYDQGRSESTFDHGYFGFEYLTITQDSVEWHQRTEYQHTSESSILHRVSIDCLDYGNTITLIVNDDWDVSSINPIADYTESGTTVTITNTVDTVYEILFTESQQNQFLCISEIANFDFESSTFDQTQGDYALKHDKNGHGVTTSLETSIVSSNSQSGYMNADLDGSTYYAYTTLTLPKGRYYISLDTYINNSDGDITASIRYRHDTAGWKTVKTIDQTNNVWVNTQCYIESFEIEATYNNVIIGFYDSNDLSVFIDNVRIYQENINIETVDFNTYKFTAIPKVLYRDGQLKTIETDIKAVLRERSTGNILQTYSQRTNFFQGFFRGKMELMEYTIEVVCTNSLFNQITYGSDSSDYIDYEDNPQDTEGLTEHLYGGTMSFGDGSRIYEASNSTSYGGWKETANFHFSQTDFLKVRVKANTSMRLKVWYECVDYTGWIFAIPFSKLGDTTNLDNKILTTEYQEYIFSMKDSVIDTHNEWSYRGTDGDVETLGWWVYQNDGASNFKVELDEVYSIKSQKHYFTPKTPNMVESDYWFDLEFDDTGFISSVNSPINQDVYNGYLKYETDGSNEGKVMEEQIIDFEYYNTLELRVYFNDTTTLQGYFDTEFLQYYNSFADQIETEYSAGWHILELDCTNFVTDTDGNKLWFSHGSSYPREIRFDYVHLYHADSSIESGKSWEFAQPNYFESFIVDWMGDDTSQVKNGYKRLQADSTTTYVRSYIDLEKTFDSSSYSYWLRLRGNGDVQANLKFRDIDNNFYSLSYKNIENSEWKDYYFSYSNSYTINRLYIYLYDQSGDLETSDYLDIDFLRFVDSSPPNLYETNQYFFTSSENNTLQSTIYGDGKYAGVADDLEIIQKDLSVGTHNISYSVFNDLDQESCYIPSSFYFYEYVIVDSDITTITMRDQQNKYIDPRIFIIEVDGTRIQGDTFYDSDTSDSYNLTISDVWGNVIYQNTTEMYERFKDFVLTLHSVKVWNRQHSPIFLEITNGPTYSEWVMPGEVVEYKLRGAQYNFTIIYSSEVEGFGAATTNGTTASYIFTVTADTAIVIDGKTIKDVFNNVLSLSNDLEAVNSTLSSQIVSVNISLSNYNTSISNQVVSVDIHLDNVNSTIATQLNDIDTQISNLDSNISIQLNDINSTILNINSSLFSQTVTILSNLENINSTLFSQTVSILSNIANTNSTLYGQTVTLLSNIANTNSTLYTQTISIVDNIINVNSTIYNQTVTMLNTLANINSTLYDQNLEIITLIAEEFGIFRVHIDYVTKTGLGIPWGTFITKMNNTRIYSQDKYYANQSLITLKTYDYFDVLLNEQSFNVTSSIDVNVSVALYSVIFRNNNTQLDSIVSIERNNRKMQFEVSPGGEQIREFTSGIYQISVSYRCETDYNSGNFSKGIHKLYTDTFTLDTDLDLLDESTDTIKDVGAPPIPVSIQDAVMNALTIGIIVGAIAAGFFSATVAYIWKTRFLEPVDDRVNFTNARRKVQDPIVEGTSELLTLGKADTRFNREKKHKQMNDRRNNNMRK